MKKWQKALVIIVVLSSGIVSLLFAPIISVSLTQYEIVPNDTGIQQINLIVNADNSNILLEYASSNNSDLIKVTCDYSVRHSILFSPSTIPIAFQKVNQSGILTVIVAINYQALQYGTSLPLSTHITINPRLISNLSVTCNSGNIDLITTNFQNLTFKDVSLMTSSGNCSAAFITGCNIQGNLSIQTSSGNSKLNVGPNSEVNGQLIITATTGNNEVTFGENCTINNNFIVQTAKGACIFSLTNCSLSNNNIIGVLESSSGAINSTITQKVVPNGNLTLDVDSDSGHCRLMMDYGNSSISSTIYPTTDSGSISYDGFVGFTAITGGNQSKNWQLSSNINVTMDTSSGKIYLQGGYL